MPLRSRARCSTCHASSSFSVACFSCTDVFMSSQTLHPLPFHRLLPRQSCCGAASSVFSVQSTDTVAKHRSIATRGQWHMTQFLHDKHCKTLGVRYEPVCKQSCLQVSDLAAQALHRQLVPLLSGAALAPLVLQQRLQCLDLPQDIRRSRVRASRIRVRQSDSIQFAHPSRASATPRSAAYQRK